jgi:hypothetical protein
MGETNDAELTPFGAEHGVRG